MYDAITRSTYAELFKTAEAKTSTQLRTGLVKVASRMPAVRDALVASNVPVITQPATVDTKEPR